MKPLHPFRIITLYLVIASMMVAGLSANAPETDRLLVIDRSFTRVSAAKATLIIEPLTRKGEIFSGEYEMKVTPFFFKSEKGKLEIVVSDESLQKAGKGEPVEITGTALTNGEDVKRKVNARATPVDKNHGQLKVWFVADEREMVFNTTYRLVER
jgi:hypothetical protein